MVDGKEYQEFCDSIQNVISSGYCVLLFHQGLGETAIFLQVVYRFKQRVGRRLLVITYVPTRTELLKASPEIDEVLEVPDDLYIRLVQDLPFRKKWGILDFLTLHEYELDRSTMKTEICQYLGIPKDTPYSKYPLPHVNANWEQFFFEKKLIPGKTVYIVPHALFLNNTVDDSFWEKLVVRIKALGYTALMNLPSETIPGVPFAYFDLIISLRLAEKCGYVIGTRTGFLDLVAAFTNIPIQAVYPDDSHPSWEILKKKGWEWFEPVYSDYAKVYMKSTGIYTLFPRENINELVYTTDEELLDSIAKNLS